MISLRYRSVKAHPDNFSLGMPTLRLLLSVAVLVPAVLSAQTRPAPPTPAPATNHAAHHPPSDSAFAATQQRGKQVMGVNQYTSTHVFEDLPDGGRIVLQRDVSDPLDERTIRMHMRDIAKRFGTGDFTLPEMVHATQVPGTTVMAQKKRRIRYVATDIPRGAQVRLTSRDPEAVKAIHEFLAFQRMDHRAAGHPPE